jgi:hypothetical protein
MTQAECAKKFGGDGIMTGQPWIGKERSFLHGRGIVVMHPRSLPLDDIVLSQPFVKSYVCPNE